MLTTITTRHCEIPDSLKERAEVVAGRLEQFAHRPVECTLLFDRDHKQPSVELRLHIARGMIFVASADAEDHRSALDRAEQKLRRQLDKPAAQPRKRGRISPA